MLKQPLITRVNLVAGNWLADRGETTTTPSG